MTKKTIKYIGIFLLVALVIMQFIRPDKNNDGYEEIVYFKTDTKPSEEVYSILEKNCFDCHTNQTVYPWYAEISPASLWLEDHINHGKKELNFSVWKNYSVKKKDHKLDELVEEIEKGARP